MSRISLIIFTGICFSGTSAWAALTGSYTNGSGMTALNALAGNPFGWTVDQVEGKWVYTYSFVPSGNNRGVAFIDLEVGGRPPADDLTYTFNYTTKDPVGVAGLTDTVEHTTLLDQTIDVRTNPDVISSDPRETPGIKQYQSFTSSADKVGTDISVATVMNGIQWFLPSWPYTSDTTLSWYNVAARQAGMYCGFNAGWKLILTTSAAPMWGRFYLDGGDWTSNNGWLMARSQQYNNPVRPLFDTSANFAAQEVQTGWIPVPNFPPSALSTTPASGATAVPVNSLISATFSGAMDPTTINSSTFTVDSASGIVFYDATTNTATFAPSPPLAPATAYTATISTAVKDATGNALAAPASWTFATAPASLFSGYISDISTDNDGNLGYLSNAWSPDIPGYPRGVRISWDIDKVGDAWRYRYTMFGNSKATDKAVTDIDIGTPDGFAATDLLPGWTMTRPDYGDITANVTASATAANFTETSSATQQMTIYGIQWHFNQDYIVKDLPATMFVLTFTTSRAPVWGDILVSSHVTAGSGYPLAWNSQFGRDTSAPVAGGNNGGWVLVPGNAGPPNARIFGAPQTYGLLQQAYDAAASGAVIQAKEMVFVEDLTMGASKDVTLVGGYGADFSPQNGYTTLQGALTVGEGTLVADHLIIE